jgi:hypothetical protein
MLRLIMHLKHKWVVVVMDVILIVILLLFTNSVLKLYLPITVVDNYKLTISKKELRTGEDFVYTMKMHKLLPIHASVNAYFKNTQSGVMFGCGTFEGSLPVGWVISQRQLTVPNMPAGNYQFMLISVFEINKMRNITYTFTDDIVDIVERK